MILIVHPNFNSREIKCVTEFPCYSIPLPLAYWIHTIFYFSNVKNQSFYIESNFLKKFVIMILIVPETIIHNSYLESLENAGKIKEYNKTLKTHILKRKALKDVGVYATIFHT